MHHTTHTLEQVLAQCASMYANWLIDEPVPCAPLSPTTQALLTMVLARAAAELVNLATPDAPTVYGGDLLPRQVQPTQAQEQLLACLATLVDLAA